MVSNYGMVGAFHRQFGLDNTLEGCQPRLLEPDVANFRSDFMSEELHEFNVAVAARDLPKMADALVDLVYVALGTAHLAGLPWEELFTEVQRANMTKQRAANAEESRAATGRGHHLDVIKPEGWTPPDIAGVLRRFGWKEGE